MWQGEKKEGGSRGTPRKPTTTAAHPHPVAVRTMPQPWNKEERRDAASTALLTIMQLPQNGRGKSKVQAEASF